MFAGILVTDIHVCVCVCVRVSLAHYLRRRRTIVASRTGRDSQTPPSGRPLLACCRHGPRNPPHSSRSTSHVEHDRANALHYSVHSSRRTHTLWHSDSSPFCRRCESECLICDYDLISRLTTV